MTRLRRERFPQARGRAGEGERSNLPPTRLTVREEGIGVNEARQDGTTALSCVLPILPGKQEAWRRFCQELEGSRHGEYEWTRQRLGITKECIWFAQMPQGEMAIVYLEMEHSELAI